MKKILLASLIVFSVCGSADGIEITRYVAEGATGQGLSEQDPSGNLCAVLALSAQVDRLTVNLAPGNYRLPLAESVDGRPTYSGVILNGGYTGGPADPNRKSVISGDLRLSYSFVSNIDFRHESVGNQYEGMSGALEVNNCNLENVDATIIRSSVSAGQSLSFTRVKSNNMSVEAGFATRNLPCVYLRECTVSQSADLGFSASYVSVIADNCSFSENKGGGMALYDCTGSVFTKCRFMKNQKNGAIFLKDVSDEISVTFDRCVISSNTTTNADRSPAISAGTPIMLANCLIANNYSMASRNTLTPQCGAVELGRRASRFYNCTFYKNHAALFYSMYPADQNNIKDPQFVNCLFLGNTVSYVSVHGQKPLMRNCAADFGSGIPELDAEQGLIPVTAESVKIEIIANEEVSVCKDSPLINTGIPTLGNDLAGFNRQMYGATDIGCREYVSTWKPIEGKSGLTLLGQEYIYVSSDYNGKQFFGLVSRSNLDEASGNVDANGMLYLGDNLSPCKVLDTWNVITYMTVNGQKAAMLQKYSNEVWNAVDWLGYTTTLPTAIKEKDRWVLKNKATAAPARKTGSTTRKRTTTRK